MTTVLDGLIDLDVLRAWMDVRALGTGDITDVSFIAGGTQNVLMRFRRDDREFVFRRPPRHKRQNSDETMRREARVLGALSATKVPHPELIAAESDETVLGAAFYLMEPVDGFNATVSLPELYLSDPAVQHSMGISMIDAIAELSLVDPAEVGLLDFGKADGWLDRQVTRWKSQLESYREFADYPGSNIGDVDKVGAWLNSNVPSRMQIGIIHGDYHFANVLMRPDEGRLAAIVDWELATIGDPLLDLGHVLACWPRGGAMPNALAALNLPTFDELIAHYARRTGRDLSDLTWYRVLAAYRLGIILEGSNARAAAGKATRDVGDLLHATAVALLALAEELIDSE